MNYTQLIEPLMDISRAAGLSILEIYQAEERGIVLKSDDSPLTLADQKANDIIVAALTELTPNIPIISEENKTVDYSIRKSYQQYWLVDPLDGTKEFIKRNGEFTVNIALIKDGRSVMGFVYVPVSEDMYYAVEGQGSFKVANGTKTQLSALRFSIKDPGLKVVASRSHLNDETKAMLEQLTDPEIVAKGSSLKFLIIAEGLAHFYPRIAPTMEWDTGAAHIILKEAGGQVIQYQSREPLMYNKENLLNPYFLAFGRLEEEKFSI
ncbi:UNVERIFIED_CONTAM: hypothetical protein GTU68_041010 [Idotea baltica]|nr:hypothetical protein [Idotea baltica]